MARSPKDAAKRRIEVREIDRDWLLDVLRREELVPEAATKIIGTGHRPDSLVVTVTFD